MNTVSPDRVESTRKNAERLQSLILRRLALVTQEVAADCMGVSSSTVSRQKEELDKFCLLMASIGLKVSPSDSVVVSPEEIRALESMAYKYLQSKVEERTKNDE